MRGGNLFLLLGSPVDASSAAARAAGVVALFLVVAKLGGDLLERFKQPPVLGEILAGILIGNLGLCGFHGLDFVRDDPSIALLAEIGVIFLLFEVGLESNVGQMLRVGGSAFLVAMVGVVVPMGLGALVARLLLPDLGWHAHVFIGAILTATSVGITARVLKDLGKIRTTEGRIILGAAVIDDVLGLIVLAVVQGIVLSSAEPGASLGAAGIVWIVAKATLFLAGAIVLGPHVARVSFRLVERLQTRGVLLAVAVAFCLALSFVAHLVGLAAIVGAFAAGLVLDEVQYKELRERETHGLEDQVRPIAAVLVPTFFVFVGARVDLSVFADARVLWLATLLTLAAIAGKQVCGLAVIERGLDRLSVGLGMIPRGEVGLIFAAAGSRLLLRGRPVVDADTYAAAVAMVVATTILTPPVLTWSLRRRHS